MEVGSILILLVVLCFGGVVLFGAPYLPTLTPQVKRALDMVDLQPGQHLVELGSGDGKVLLAAAQRGVMVTGYELNPILALISWFRTWRYRRLVTIVWGNFWHRPLPVCDAVFVFLLPKYMEKLDKKIAQEIDRDVKLVSFAFRIPGRTHTATQEGVYLYTYRNE